MLILAMSALLSTAAASPVIAETAIESRDVEPSVGSPSLPGSEIYPISLRRRLENSLAERGPDYIPRSRHRNPDGSPRYSNRLLLETSPYLQQHAHNPVNWNPWGSEAFETARRLGRPLLVSIGYSTCHWCHVMEEESFDDIELARYLNESFIAIKVDREVRPDCGFRMRSRRGSGAPIECITSSDDA